MPAYAIVVHRRGHDSEVTTIVHGDKGLARIKARQEAEHAFPDCRLRWSADCVMAFRDGEHQGDVSVERR